MQARRRTKLLGVLVAAMGVVACSDSEPSSSSSTTGGQPTDASEELWAAPDDPMALAVEAGLEPDTTESFTHHVHAHLDVFVDGQPITIPAGIGININDPGVKRFDEDGQIGYGGIQGCDQPCISPLHTHDETGIIHTESPTDVDNTLGQLFIEWELRLDDECVANYCRPDEDIEVYVDGELYDGNPADVELSDGREIAIVIGTPPDEIPATADLSGA